MALYQLAARSAKRFQHGKHATAAVGGAHLLFHASFTTQQARGFVFDGFDRLVEMHGLVEEMLHTEQFGLVLVDRVGVIGQHDAYRRRVGEIGLRQVQQHIEARTLGEFDVDDDDIVGFRRACISSGSIFGMTFMTFMLVQSPCEHHRAASYKFLQWSPSADQLVLDGVIGQVGIGLEIHFFQDTGAIGAHGFHTDEQFFADGGH